MEFFSVSCGTPSFASRVDVEPFNSTSVGPEIAYQCQSGLLPEGRITSVCGGEGRWNPDPATLMCKGNACYQVSLLGTQTFDYLHDLMVWPIPCACATSNLGRAHDRAVKSILSEITYVMG